MYNIYTSRKRFGRGVYILYTSQKFYETERIQYVHEQKTRQPSRIQFVYESKMKKALVYNFCPRRKRQEYSFSKKKPLKEKYPQRLFCIFNHYNLALSSFSLILPKAIPILLNQPTSPFFPLLLLSAQYRVYGAEWQDIH